MVLVDMALIIFMVLEGLNVLILYLNPEFKYGNGIAVFNAWESSKEDENIHLFARYMTNWVAGTKLIFIFLLFVILMMGSTTLKLWAMGAMCCAILTYFWKLHPIIKQLDEMGEIKPAGYSKTQEQMIAGFLVMFTVTMLVYAIF